RVGQQRLDWRVGFVTGLVAEALQMIIILLVSRPFADAWALVQVIAVPMTLVNASGLALFLLIIKEGVDQEDRLVCFYTHKVLEVARDTLPFLRRGLDPQSAQEVARLIQTRTGAAAVALTDQTGVLAHVGIGADHHRPGDPIRTAATRQALTEGLPQVAAGAHEIGCEIKGCPLGSGVVVPLVVRGQVVGTLKLYQPKNTPVSPPLVEQATGMAGLFSTQLELADLERQAQMATRAELKALRAQINPHFLFNALNTISSFVRTDPDGARNLLAHLSDFFRRTLRSSEELVTVAEELELVESYLTIELARFGPRLRVETNVAPALLRCPIPPFTLQPLVENAVKHGLLPRSTGGTIRLTGRMDGGAAVLTVADDGDGMDPGVAAGALVGRSSGRGIGLINVNERLKGHFGPDAGLSIHTARGAGTTITLRLPAPVVISRAAASTKEV
ncbi:MAG TPA: histidine kinase, partial [Symbiobacteriaceae bacterium]|nr:histidine kinase [Symbiobacteriaceae bacterium]